MTTWNEFAKGAPRIAEIFLKRHAAAGNLCMLATLRTDGFPRISPVEPRIFEGGLWIVGMPGTTKFADLGRDPRFCLHTATTDTHVTEGDAKLFGRVADVQDPALHERFAEDLFAESGFDLRGQKFAPFYGADITGGSAVTTGDNHMNVTIWTPAKGEWVVEKH